MKKRNRARLPERHHLNPYYAQTRDQWTLTFCFIKNDNSSMYINHVWQVQQNYPQITLNYATTSKLHHSCFTGFLSDPKFKLVLPHNLKITGSKVPHIHITIPSRKLNFTSFCSTVTLGANAELQGNMGWSASLARRHKLLITFLNKIDWGVTVYNVVLIRKIFDLSFHGFRRFVESRKSYTSRTIMFWSLCAELDNCIRAY